MPYKIYPCPDCKYYQEENNKCFCNNTGLFGYRKELKEEVRFCYHQKTNDNNNK